MTGHDSFVLVIKTHLVSLSFTRRQTPRENPDLGIRARHELLEYSVWKLRVWFATHSVEVLIHFIWVCKAEIYQTLIPITGPRRTLVNEGNTTSNLRIPFRGV